MLRVQSFPVQLQFRGVTIRNNNLSNLIACLACLLLVAGWVIHLQREEENRAVVSGYVREQEHLHLICQESTIIADVVFASYGSPQGQTNGVYTIGSCHVPVSAGIVAGLCLGRKECTITADAPTFGEVCPDIHKSLAVKIICAAEPDFRIHRQFNTWSRQFWAQIEMETPLMSKQRQRELTKAHLGISTKQYSQGIIMVVSKREWYPRIVFGTIERMRRAGCKIPVELWHVGSDSMPKAVKERLSIFHVETIDFETMFPVHLLKLHRSITGYARFQLKALALLHTSFTEVLLIDPDVTVIGDPTRIFVENHMENSTAVFWAGAYETSAHSPIWKSLNLPNSHAHAWEQDSGFMLVRPTRASVALNLSVDLLSEPYSQLFREDIDAFRLAWLATETPFIMSQNLPALVGGVNSHSLASSTHREGSFCGMSSVHLDRSQHPLYLRQPTPREHQVTSPNECNFCRLKKPLGSIAIRTIMRGGYSSGGADLVAPPGGCLDFESDPAYNGSPFIVEESSLGTSLNAGLDQMTEVPIRITAIPRLEYGPQAVLLTMALAVLAFGVWNFAHRKFMSTQPAHELHFKSENASYGQRPLFCTTTKTHIIFCWGNLTTRIQRPSTTQCSILSAIMFFIYYSHALETPSVAKLYTARAGVAQVVDTITQRRRPIPRVPSYFAQGTHCISCNGAVCIPKRVTVTYYNEILHHHKLLETLLSPDYSFHYYNDNQAIDFVATHCPNAFAALNCIIPNAFKADIFRYCVLYHSGGIYMDNDLALLVRPEELYNANCSGVSLLAEYTGDKGYDVRLWSGLIISAVHEPLWQCMLDQVISNVKSRYYGSDPVDITGPGLLVKCFYAHYNRSRIFGWNERDSTMLQYPELNGGVALQVSHEVGQKRKGDPAQGGRIHYSQQWREGNVYRTDCKL